MKIKVENMQSPSSGRDVANQFVIYAKEGKYFQSYDSLIVFKPSNGGPTQLDKYAWKYSATTSKYRSRFLGGETTAQTLGKINKGVYELTDLNK